MPKIYESALIEAPVEKVWAAVRDYNAIAQWHPGIKASRLEGEGVGCVRHITFDNGGQATERLLGLSDEERSVTYAFVDSPMAVSGYKATLRFLPITATGETFAEWIGTYDDTNLARRRESAATLQEIFRSGLAGIGKFVKNSGI
jgi:hypothetical protein